MVAGDETNALPTALARLQKLCDEGRKDEFALACRELLRVYGRNSEALMRLARFCQKRGQLEGFELFMVRLAQRLPASRSGILLTLGEHLIKAGRRRGLAHLAEACQAAGSPEAAGVVTARAVEAAAAYLAGRDDWEDAVRQFPPDVQGDLYLELAARFGPASPEKAWRAYRRGLAANPRAWPGQALAEVAAAYARRLAPSEPERAVEVLLWASERADDPHLVSQAAAVALAAGDKERALSLSRQAARRLPNDLENLGRLAALQAEKGQWGQVAALAPAIGAGIARLNPWQREEYRQAADLAVEALLRTGRVLQARTAVDQMGLPGPWRQRWENRLKEEQGRTT
ncbi:MAG: hypothetical protein H0Z37_09800 [Firmicutes bacterium]|nr:hypothetical protein [Bacillota bacterium]